VHGLIVNLEMREFRRDWSNLVKDHLA
jgi:hypothetical protein